MTDYSYYKKIGKAISEHKLKFFQIEMDGATYLLPGTPETLSESLGVRTTFTPEILIQRIEKKFNAQCQFISYAKYRRKVELAQNPEANIFVIMNYKRIEL